MPRSAPLMCAALSFFRLLDRLRPDAFDGHTDELGRIHGLFAVQRHFGQLLYDIEALHDLSENGVLHVPTGYARDGKEELTATGIGGSRVGDRQTAGRLAACCRPRRA